MRTWSLQAAGILLVGLIVLGVWAVVRSDASGRQARVPHASDDAHADDDPGPPAHPPARPASAPVPMPLPAQAGDEVIAAAARTAEAPDRGGLTVVATHAQGAPAAGATVVVVAQGTVLAQGTCSPRGVAALNGFDVPVELWVAGATLAVARFELQTGRGVHEVELPGGRLLSGVVLVDGRAPEEPVGLYLRPGDAHPPVPSTHAVRTALESVATGWGTEIGQATGEDGTFLFGGLPDDWSGWIEFPFRYILASGEDWTGFEVPWPATGLVVRLAQRGSVRGRVVDVAGEPVPRAVVAYELHQGDGSVRAQTDRAGEDGRFEILLRHESIEALVIDLASPAGDGTASIRPTDVDPRLGLDLGDVVLAGTREIPFVVRDASGAPVAGAVARAADGSRARGGPTDAAGRATLVGGQRHLAAMHVTALGYAEVEVALPARVADPVIVTLPRTANLHVRVLAPDGSPVRRMSVGVRSDHPVFEGDVSWAPSEWQRSLGATSMISGGRDGDRVRMRGLTGDDGRVHLTGFRPDVSFELDVLDACGTPTGAPMTLVLRPREQRTVDWRLAAGPRDVVVDAAGAAVDGAHVRLGDRTQTSSRGSTGRDGRAVVARVLADRADLGVRKDGYGAVLLQDCWLPPADEPLVVTLEPVEPLTVHVVDADGRSAGAEQVSLLGLGEPIHGSPLEEGAWRFAVAPRGAVRFGVVRGWRTMQHQCDTRVRPVRIVLPVPGSLQVDWTVPLDHAQWYLVSLRDAGPDGWSHRQTVHRPDGPDLDTVRWDVLEPGRYEVQLLVRPSGMDWQPASPSVLVAVEPGRAASVTLRP